MKPKKEVYGDLEELLCGVRTRLKLYGVKDFSTIDDLEPIK